MPDSAGSSLRRAALAACVTLVANIAAAAQQPSTTPPSTLRWLPRFDAQLMFAGLSSEDDRFSQDGRTAIDFDVLDYVVGRLSMLADYQVIMGNEFGRWDANQGNYTLAAAASARVRRTEFAVFFHHVSRHLSDRAAERGVAVNLIGGRAARRVRIGAIAIDMRVDVGKVKQRSYVDYSSLARATLIAQRPVAAKLALFGRGLAESWGVDAAVAGRHRQNGGRVEGGLRITGGAATVEVFGGYERVVDAHPFDRQPQRWAFAGFRLMR